MKKEKIFNKIVFTSILLILCYFCSCVSVYADCKEKKYHPSSTIAGVGDDNYYPIVKTVINLDETLSSDAEKNAYGKVIKGKIVIITLTLPFFVGVKRNWMTVLVYETSLLRNSCGFDSHPLYNLSLKLDYFELFAIFIIRKSLNYESKLER